MTDQEANDMVARFEKQRYAGDPRDLLIGYPLQGDWELPEMPTTTYLIEKQHIKERT